MEKFCRLHTRIWVALLIFIILGGSAVFFFVHKNKTTPPAEQKVHYHAGFQVYVDGVKQDFSDFKYMNLVPCSKNPKNQPPEDPQLEKAHLHDRVGDVVHIEHEGAVWGDLFKNIHYSFDTTKQIVGYVNDQKVSDIFSTHIKPNDSVVIVVGSQKNVQQYLKNKVTQAHIAEISKKSESCGVQ